MAAGLGFKDFVTGEVLTAADVDGYLMQGVWVFASAAARDAAVTSPQEGNFAYLKDTNVTTYYTGSAWANLDTTGMTNPMTTTGDTIYSSSGSTPARLGIGSTGQVLTVAAGIPSWATPAGGGGGLVFIGNTTFSSSNTINVNDVFSTTYDNYRILIVGASAGGVAAQLSFRLRVSGSDTNTNYQYLRINADGGAVTTDNNVIGTDEIFFGSLGTSANTKSLQVYDIAAPYLTSDTSIAGTSGRTGAAYQMNINYGVQTSSTSFTGFTILSSENATGTIAVYGYAKA